MDRGHKIADGTFDELACARRSRRGRLEPRADLPARHRPEQPCRRALRVLRASLYIIVCSARNRARVRLRRLREPRYLIGAIVGVAYIYFSFFGRFRSAQSTAARNARRGATRHRTERCRSVPGLIASGAGVHRHRAAARGSGQLAVAVRQRPARFLGGRNAVPVSGAGVAPAAAAAPDAPIAARSAVRRRRARRHGALGVRLRPAAAGRRDVVAARHREGLLHGRVADAGADRRRKRAERRLAWLPPAIVLDGGGDRRDRADAGVPRGAARGDARRCCGWSATSRGSRCLASSCGRSWR